MAPDPCSYKSLMNVTCFFFLCRLRDVKQRFHLNLQVQLLMKQGQVELDAGSFIHNYKDSVLIHRGVVEDLNGKIKVCLQT